VSVTLRRLKVENPDEESVSVGELGHEWIAITHPQPSSKLDSEDG